LIVQAYIVQSNFNVKINIYLYKKIIGNC